MIEIKVLKQRVMNEFIYAFLNHKVSTGKFLNTYMKKYDVNYYIWNESSKVVSLIKFEI